MRRRKKDKSPQTLPSPLPPLPGMPPLPGAQLPPLPGAQMPQPLPQPELPPAPTPTPIKTADCVSQLFVLLKLHNCTNILLQPPQFSHPK